MFLLRRGSQDQEVDQAKQALIELRHISEYIEGVSSSFKVADSPGTGREQKNAEEDGDPGDVVQAVMTQCEELRHQVKALMEERNLATAQLEVERRKSVEVATLLEQSQQQIRALEMELDTSRANTEKELAVSTRKSQLLSKRLVEISTKLDEPEVTKIGVKDNSPTNSDSADGVRSLRAPWHGGQYNIPGDGSMSRENVTKGAKAAADQLESTRACVGSFKQQWGSMRQEAEEAKQRIAELEQQQHALLGEVAKLRTQGQQTRQSCAEISEKLSDAESSWNPWKEIDECKQKLCIMKDNTAEEMARRIDGSP